MGLNKNITDAAQDVVSVLPLVGQLNSAILSIFPITPAKDNAGAFIGRTNFNGTWRKTIYRPILQKLYVEVVPGLAEGAWSMNYDQFFTLFNDKSKYELIEVIEPDDNTPQEWKSAVEEKTGKKWYSAITEPVSEALDEAYSRFLLVAAVVAIYLVKSRK